MFSKLIPSPRFRGGGIIAFGIAFGIIGGCLFRGIVLLEKLNKKTECLSSG